MGNLHRPDEIDSYTPEPDLAAGIWFARDVAAMAAALETDPVMLVLRESPVKRYWRDALSGRQQHDPK